MMNLADLSKINLTDLAKRKDILAVLGIVVAAVIIGRNFIYLPQQTKINYLRREIEETETKNRLVREIIALNKDGDFYKKRLPVQKDASWLIRKITQLAKGAQVKIISFQPGRLDRQEGYIRIPLEIKVRAGYHKLGEFLSNIENSAEFVRVDSLNFTVLPGEEQIKRAAGRETEIQGEYEDNRPLISLVVSTIYLEK